MGEIVKVGEICSCKQLGDADYKHVDNIGNFEVWVFNNHIIILRHPETGVIEQIVANG